MKIIERFLIILTLFIGMWGVVPSANAQSAAPKEAAADSVVRYPVSKTSPENYEDIGAESAADLRTPANIKTDIEYDPITNRYILRTRVGETEIATPFSLTAEEYGNYSFRKSMEAYYREKNAYDPETAEKDKFDFLNMNFSLGPLEKVFGPGGVQLKTQGSVEVDMGVKYNKIDNPALSLEARSKTYFDFDTKIQATVNAKVGNKLGFNLNYNTDATFAFDSQNLKLQFQGEEDDIVKNIEAGNVSMTTGSSLIRGSTSLFGFKTTLQFGKLTATALVSQQQSETKTVSTSGGVQTTPFEFNADKYDENRHFFLAHYFRDNYDQFASKLPYVQSGITINRIEVWVTNKQGKYDQSRNIVGFMDLGESDRIYNDHWRGSGNPLPMNNANTLLSEIKSQYPDARNINSVSQALEGLSVYGFEGGQDFVKIESARKLNSNEYTLNSALGYISLKVALNSDEMVAVAYEYTYGGQVYQVGEFSSDITATDQCLYLKLLKGVTVSPQLPIWDLMMKNVYSLNAYQLKKDHFRLEIKYLSDSTGVLLNYIPAGNIAEKTLLQAMNLDRLDANQESHSDGFYDYIEGYTVQSSNGRIIFPVVEPFGSHLAAAIGDKEIAEKYIFQELYDSTLTVAQQVSDRNKFVITGEYQASSGSEISLGAMNVPRGSVVVTAGGVTLVENSDYTVDYTMGTVRILNQSIIDAGTPINVSLENQSLFNMQRKTMLGLDLTYAFTKDFKIGGTILHLSEKPITNKVNTGSELLNNTLWGLNLSYNTKFNWLTNWLNLIPTVNATAPSTLSVTGEFAQLVTHQAPQGSQKGMSYLDDFESTQTGIDLRSPYAWNMASTPSMFAEASLNDNPDYGKNRALLAWYYIDRMFTDKHTSLAPSHIKNDYDQLSNPYVREVSVHEMFPNKELTYGESTTIQTLNLSFYPEERGPYNLDTERIDAEGNLLYPESRWGGIMRKMDNTDFETGNIETIRFWMMDPFLDPENPNYEGGDLYINLGEISEDILKDGMKSFENGMPIDGDSTHIDVTNWGKVSRNQSLTYAFDNTAGARKLQDVGLDGLTNDEEYNFPTYRNYLNELSNRLSAETQAHMRQDQFSPYNDPAGDNYHFYRGVDYDNEQMSVLERYKRYNGVEGNSASSEDVDDPYYQSSRSVPDVEDVNQDNTLNEYERYFQYRISIRPEDLVVGRNFITDSTSTEVTLRNGQKGRAVWYQFKVPVSEFESRIGSINDFKTIRFIRMFMTGFKKPTHLRFATFELVRGEWRTYQYSLNNRSDAPAQGSLDMSVVNIEENAGQRPVNYVLPPGVTRIVDPSQSQATQLNEQALALKVTDLQSGDARAVYKNISMDLRYYKRIQMFVHAEKLIDDYTDLKDGDLTIFMRIGSDSRSNYYEYEIPLMLTPEGHYSTYNVSDQYAVWPVENMFDFALDRLPELKTLRNRSKKTDSDNVSFTQPYSIYDPDNERNRMTVVGNPSLSNIRTILIGVRNNSGNVKNGTIWVNELRLTDFDQSGGWAAKGNINLGISDIATVNVGGHIETSGFGSIDQSLTQRRMDDYYQYNVATQVDLGRFLPEKAEVSAPLYYSYSEQVTSPQYNPVDEDVKLSDALDAAIDKHERDSISSIALERKRVESLSITGVKVNVKSENPMPYDPANFTLGYSYNRQSNSDPTTTYENTYDHRGSLTYSYTPYVKPFKPFSGIKSESKNMKFLQEWELNYVPTNLTFNTNISRYYYEQQTRDLNSIVSGIKGIDLPVSVSKNFLWDRQFSLQWNLTKSLNFSLQTMTNARVDETAGVVNRDLFPDEYKIWQDSVWSSIKGLGSPWDYNQTFNASWTAPFNKIAAIDFLSFSVKYNATYNWEKGTEIEGVDMGNVISNQAQWNFDGRINLEQLYNKIPYLQKVNKRFAATKGNSSRVNSRATKQKNKYERTITLKEDTSVVVRHNLKSKKVNVTATNLKGEAFAIETRVVDDNNIEVLTRGKRQIKVKVIIPEEQKTFWSEAGQYSARFLMMVRNVSARYREVSSMNLPLFRPVVGDGFGQTRAFGPMAPGLDFAFGFTDESFVQRAIDNNWLIRDELQINPAVSGLTKELNFDVDIEPIAGLKIKLTGNWNQTNSSQMQFMFEGNPTVYGGNYTKTHIAILTSLRPSSVENGYQSDAFDQFMENRKIIAGRYEKKYEGTSYPTTGFMKGHPLAGRPYDSNNGGVNHSSPDVMIPAFLAAYSGISADNVALTAFPAMSSVLPNWRITYDGLMQIAAVKEHFKSFTINHAYQCTYAVGSYSSFMNWINSGGNDMGFTLDELSGNPIPSSPYDISSVSITERFAPFIGVNATMKNNITFRAEYNDGRVLTLNSSAGQIVEANTTDITVGVSYKIANFNKILKIGSKQTGVNNDLTINGDFSWRNTISLIRRIDENYTQATTGTRTLSLKATANYVLSKRITLGVYFDHQVNTPLVSSSAYPVTNSNYGVSIQLSLVK